MWDVECKKIGILESLPVLSSFVASEYYLNANSRVMYWHHCCINNFIGFVAVHSVSILKMFHALAVW